MMSKTVLFLGASHQQLAPIEYAKRVGYRVITCDNRPENPGHQLADEHFNVSTIDLDGVLEVAKATGVDGVVCYGSDVSAPAAAYVAEKLNLAGNPLPGVRILTNKSLFRSHQVKHGYFAPKHLTLMGPDLENESRARSAVAESVGFPVVVKPVDGAGSKGVSKIHEPGELFAAIRKAASFSITNNVIVEELLIPVGYQICGEGFLLDGEIVFHAFANEHFCRQFVVPVGETFPSIFDERIVARGVDVLQKIFLEVGLRQGPFNFDLMFLENGEVFVVEIGPRNGGNRMPEAILRANGADTIAATVEVALGRPVELRKLRNHFYATYSVHSKHDGILESVEYLGDIRKKIVDEKLFAREGDTVHEFHMGSLMLGNLILSFDTYPDMLSTLDNMDEFIKVNVSGSH